MGPLVGAKGGHLMKGQMLAKGMMRPGSHMMGGPMRADLE